MEGQAGEELFEKFAHLAMHPLASEIFLPGERENHGCARLRSTGGEHRCCFVEPDIWQVENPTIADQVPIERDMALYRSMAIAPARTSRSPGDTRAFSAYLQGPEAAQIFRRHGWRARLAQKVSMPAMTKVALVLAAMSMSMPASAAPPAAQSPAVPGHGPIVPAPDTANQPDPATRYRVVFNITKAPSDPSQPNPSLVKVARFLNLLATRGIRPAQGDVVAIVHGPATPLVMSDAAYRAQFKVANPNLALIDGLKRTAAQVHVCSQALHGHQIATESVAADVTVDLSAITTLATLQLQGFALIPD